MLIKFLMVTTNFIILYDPMKANSSWTLCDMLEMEEISIFGPM